MQDATSKIKNIKGHFKVKYDYRSLLDQRLSELIFHTWVIPYHNFTVFKKSANNLYTYIVFPKNGYINVTGIKSYSQICSAIENFCNVFHFSKQHVHSFSVDNITASGQLLFELDLSKVSETFSVYCTRYDVNIFPGLLIKVQNLGTITLFSSGKYTIVGVKCIRQLAQISQLVLTALEQEHTAGLNDRMGI
jgi:TATA-box binding protein (TBP) (component of TFIID and TFIIIB)